MTRRARLVAILLLLVGVGAAFGYHYYAQQGSPNALIGEYGYSDSGPIVVHITSRDGGYYVTFETPSGPSTPIPLIPMTTEDQVRIGGGAVNLRLVGLKATEGTFMIFKVDPGWSNWGETFTTGYGTYGGPYVPGVKGIHKR